MIQFKPLTKPANKLFGELRVGQLFCLPSKCIYLKLSTDTTVNAFNMIANHRVTIDSNALCTKLKGICEITESIEEDEE